MVLVGGSNCELLYILCDSSFPLDDPSDHNSAMMLILNARVVILTMQGALIYRKHLSARG